MDEIGCAAPGEPAAPGRLVSRRRVLFTAAGVVVAGAAGAGVALARPVQSHSPPQPPATLADALAAERRLAAGLLASAAADPGRSGHRALLAQLAADHRAHADAIAALLADYPGAAAAIRPGPGTALTSAQLRAAEHRAGLAAARRAAAHTGTTATLFASIAACEAGHASLLGTG